MEALKSKLARVKGTADRYERFLESINSNTSIYELKVRLEKIEDMYNEFIKIDDQWILSGKKVLDREKEFEEFEARYFKLKSEYTKIISERDSSSPVSNDQLLSSTIVGSDGLQKLFEQQNNILERLSSTAGENTDTNTVQRLAEQLHTLSASNVSRTHGVHLPSLTIKAFSGEYNDFQPFWDNFTASVHNRTDLTKAQKFQYLKGLLPGSVGSVIDKLLVTDNNYDEAVTQLKERYDKPSLVIDALLKDFFNIKKVEISNATLLRIVVTDFEQVIRGLRALGPQAETRDPWLIALILKKIDCETHTAWAEHIGSNPYPTIEELVKFLNSRCDALERGPSTNAKAKSFPTTKYKTSRAYLAAVGKACPECQQDHHLSYCPTYKSLDVTQRRYLVHRKNLCFNCLKENHIASKCPSKHFCQRCQKLHHTSLHVDYNLKSTYGRLSSSSQHNFQAGQPNALMETNESPQSSQAKTPQSSVAKTPSTSTSSNLATQASHVLKASLDLNDKYNVLLPTAMVYVKDQMGNLQPCNVLLDSGCQNTLITASCAQRLGLPRSPASVQICGLSGSHVGVSKGKIHLQICPLHSKEVCLEAYALVFNSITSDQPAVPINSFTLSKISSLNLADPNFSKPKKIDILLGVDYFFSTLLKDQVKEDGIVVAQKTIFGWVICGPHLSNSHSLCNMSTQTAEESLNATLQLFWKTEKLPTKPAGRTKEEQKAENIFKSTYKRDDDGKYLVKLPFNSECPVIGNSYNAAEKRLVAMERKFLKNKNLMNGYKKFMSEYLKLGHMELVPDEELNSANTQLYYLPHHAVLKDNSLTTKLRVVFDGSCKSDNGVSLNEILLTGEALQQDLPAILTRFRCVKYCFSCDIEKMFRMIGVQKADRDFQRILWRDDASEKMRVYRLTTVTYGTKPAPYLSMRTLLQLCEDEGLNFPLAVKSLHENFFVDNGMAGANSIEESKELVCQLVSLLRAGGFKLKQWASNCPEVISNIPLEDKVDSLVEIPNDFNICLLGVSWNPKKDSFLFQVARRKVELDTKRKLLSEISRIFDPLGWVSPSIIMAKIILQELWLLKVGWDDTLPLDIVEKSTQLYDEMNLLNEISIPRIIYVQGDIVQYHGFCDASSSAYSAVIYCRRISPDNSISVSIVIAKTKVAPLKELSIPKLELSGAYLLAELFEFLKSAVGVIDNALYCWTDSKIVLAWLSSYPKKWKPFVSNRTSFILETLPNAKWLHVPSKDNPADCASRGIKPSLLITHNLWWTGPAWLSKEECEWPNTGGAIYATQEEERSAQLMTLQISTIEPGVAEKLLTRKSQWKRLVRIIAYCKRFIQIYLSKIVDKSPLLVTELQEAKNIFYRVAQEESFHDDIKNLRKHETVPANSKLKRLAPYIDENGILRVGGRLGNSGLEFEKKHQVILHKNHILARRIVEDCHMQNHHAGVTMLIAFLRQNYWIIGIRDLVKSVVYPCVTCYRHSKRTAEQLMGNIPKFRLQGIHPFYDTGCDYAGPLILRQHSGRKAPLIKGYIALFICLTTRALHLELVSDLSSDAFLAALRRFISRRGLCAHIRSDNGTNFVGAARQLGELYRLVASHNTNHVISDFLSSKGIQWHFIPPGAPHFGGSWESGVKSVKFHLKRVVGQTTLNFEEMTTLLTQIEAILNSRPLCAQADSDDISCLTPGHFLVGRPLVAVPEPDLTNVKLSLLARWRLVQQLTQSFWSRWSLEYLTSLQQRQKWFRPKLNIKIDDIVLLKDENNSPTYWKLGRVIETHAGSDGLIRVATIRTKSGDIKRPVTKLCVLPLYN